MRRFLLASTLLTMAAAPITPGGSSITDASGNRWDISPSGSIQENGDWVAGGGGTSALTIGPDGTIYGEDAHGLGWFTFGDQFWTPSAAPSGSTASLPTVLSATAPSPAVTVPAPICGGGVASGGFHVAGGRIIGPDGKDFIARGFNMADNDLEAAGQITSVFPGVNFVRLAIYQYQSADAYAGFVNQLTSRGIVVEFEHHVETDGSVAGGGKGGIASGAWLAAESAFYASIASAFRGNPYVWFGSTNEPPTQTGLSQWQLATYQAIRGTGNNNPILLEISGWPGGWMTSLDPSVYRQMTNVVWDPHYYGWISRYSTDQPTVDQALADEIAGAQAITSADGVMPVIIGEYGPSTTGAGMDVNGDQAVTSVVNMGGSGKAGSAAWHWGMQDCCNNLNSGSSLTSFGQTVSLFIGVTTQSCTADEQTKNALATVAAVTQQVADAPASPDVQAADQTIQQADAILAGVPK